MWISFMHLSDIEFNPVCDMPSAYFFKTSIRIDMDYCARILSTIMIFAHCDKDIQNSNPSVALNRALEREVQNDGALFDLLCVSVCPRGCLPVASPVSPQTAYSHPI